MKPYILTTLACITFLAAVLLHEHRADERMRKLGNQLELGLDGIECSMRP